MDTNVSHQVPPEDEAELLGLVQAVVPPAASDLTVSRERNCWA
jgi:hypothetical protein